MPAMTLADFIDTQVECILQAWEVFANDIISAHDLDPVTARDYAEGILMAIAADLRRAQTRDQQAEKSKGRGPHSNPKNEAVLHGFARQATGFSVNEEIAEFRALRASVVRLWTDTLSPAEKDSSPIFDQVQRFHEAIDQALAESVEAFAAEKEERDRLFNTLLSASPDLHFVLGPDGRLLYANQALCGVQDILPCDMIGRTLSDIGSPVAAEFQPYFEQVLATREAHRGDVSYRLPKGPEETY